MNFVVIIPARFFSTRFPGKPLADIHGKPMVVRVMEKALASGASRVIVATDDISIAKVIKAEQSLGEVCLTRSDHQSGTDRIEEVAMFYKFTDNQIIVHLQVDEPLISSNMIRQVANLVKTVSDKNNVVMVTLATPLYSLQEALDSNVVKVVVNINNNALYFSRSMIPWNHRDFDDYQQEKTKNMLLRHIGIYAYRVNFLRHYVKWPKSPLEQLEKLEQLRVLWYGEQIYVTVIDNIHNISVDTPDALIRVNALFCN